MFFSKKKNVEIDYNYDKPLYCIFDDVCEKYKDYRAVTDTYNNVSLSYGEVYEIANNFASGLQSLGIKKGDFVAHLSENHGRWIIGDLGIMKCGAISAVRGSNAPVDELEYIIKHSDSKALLLRDIKLYNKLKPLLNNLNVSFVIITFVNSEIDKEGINCPVYSFDEVVEMGKNHEFQPVELCPLDDLTLLYTSGTTGNPKGVLLTHKNFIYQVITSHEKFLSQPGEKTLHVLPIWHAYERVGQYYYFSRACHMHFTTLAGMKNDLSKYDIDTMMSVPRIWEAMRKGIYQTLRQKSPLLYKIFKFGISLSMAYKESAMYIQRRVTNKRIYSPITTVMSALTVVTLTPIHKIFKHTIYKQLKKAAGLDFRASISGGGALAIQDEYFYDAINVNLRVGYGLTETSPVITVRGVQEKNFLGSAGTPLYGTEVKIVDPTTFKELKKFRKGLVLVKGPQVFKCYYKDPEATKAVFTPDGWFNTGDLGWITKTNNLVLFGRLKETIVLSTGENVEPVPIEDACLGSDYIEQIVLVGQDKNGVGALVIPSKKALDKCGVNIKDLRSQKSSAIENQELRHLIKKEIDTYIKQKPKLRPFEKIMKFEMLKDAFSLDNGLMTQSLKIKRNNVFEKYKDIIQKMYTDKKK